MTTPAMSGDSLPEQFRHHAGQADHLYGHLMRAMADDWEQAGPVREICAGYEQVPPGWVIQLRLLAGVFRIVLTGRAPQLEPFYPNLGGAADPADAWPLVRDVLASHVEELHEALLVAPQTNEVGRANALLVGIFHAVRRTGRQRVRLLEPGASAGLNLLLDDFRFANQGWSFGPESSPVQLVDGVLGNVAAAEFDVVARRGCDPSPVDSSTAEGRLRLRSFVWPFHVERHERLTAALEVAARRPPVVDRATAADWLAEALAQPPVDGELTVVWQSITRQYWPPEEVERTDRLVRDAAVRRPLAHVSMEFPEAGARAELTVTMSDGPDGGVSSDWLGTVGDHGFPVRIGG